MTQEREWDVFRFPRTLIVALRVGAFVFPALGLLIYPTFRHPGLLEVGFLAAFFGSLTLIVLAIQLQMSAFSVAVSRQCLQLNNWRRQRRTVDFSAIHKLVIVWPWRRRGRLDLIDGSGKRLCRLDGGIEDFDQLVALVRLYSPDQTVIREKDTRGHWTEQRNV